jgi:hypothetical protein
MMKSEVFKIIILALCAIACGLKATSYIVLTYPLWHAALGVVICTSGFLVFTYGLCRSLAMLVLRLENRSDAGNTDANSTEQPPIERVHH